MWWILGEWQSLLTLRGRFSTVCCTLHNSARNSKKIYASLQTPKNGSDIRVEL